MEKDEKKKAGFPNLLGRPKSDEQDTPPPAAAPAPQSNNLQKQQEEQKKREAEEAQKAEDKKETTTTTTKKMNDDEVTNNISADLSEQDKKEIYDAMDLIRRKLAFAKDFDDDEKEGLMRLGKTGRSFVEKAQDLVKRSPGILPRSFDTDEFHRDAELYQELGDISDELQKLSEKVADSEAAVGSDAFTAALVVYQSGKLARVGDDMDNHLTGWRRKLTIDD